MPNPSRLSVQNAVTLYLAYREAEGLRPTTLAGYRFALAKFAAEPGLPEYADELTADDAVRWLAGLRDAGLAPGGISTYQRAVWTWFTWLYQGDMLAIDIAHRVKRVRVPNPKRRTATTEAHDRMVVVAAHKREHALRDVAIIELLWSSGMRRAECAGLNLEDLDLDGGTIAVYHAKGGKPRVAAIDAVARLRLTEYLVKVRQYDRPGPLFLDRHGKAVSSNAIKLMLKRVATLAGVTVASHDLRRAAAARMLRDGMAADDAARLLGHSTGMTLIYGEEGRTERAVRAYHERDAGVRPLRRRGA